MDGSGADNPSAWKMLFPGQLFGGWSDYRHMRTTQKEEHIRDKHNFDFIPSLQLDNNCLAGISCGRIYSHAKTRGI